MQSLQAAFGTQVRFAVQAEQRGTGHAALQGLQALEPEADRVLIVYGDCPLVVVDDLRALVAALDAAPHASLAMLTCSVPQPHGYGRIVRDDQGRVVQVREERDLTEAQRGICEVNPGMYLARVPFLREALASLSPNNAQGELYLTDVVELAARAGGVVDVRGDASNLLGVNDRAQLVEAEELMYERIAQRLRREGVTVRAGARIEATVQIEADATIESAVVLRGRTRIGAGARVDVGCVVTDAVVQAGAYLKAYSVVTESTVGAGAQIGPFAHLRPGSDIGPEAHIGNFVETKKTRLARGAKANHLAYLGDGEVGEHANVGAGTIFCNYDGFQKHRTVIGAGAFIGSDSQLVAPVVVGDGAYVATGTTVTHDVPPDALAIGRARQENKEGYASRLRTRLGAAARAAKSK